jgi:trehalose 6-phosphate phosphatase
MMPPFQLVQDPGALALFLDVDGTLIDFAATPEAARAPADLPAILQAASSRTAGALALISGRSIAELDRLMAPLQLPAAGLHGAEFRFTEAALPSTAASLPPQFVQKLAAETARFPGARFEDKGASVAIHFRAAPSLAAELHELLLRYLARAGTPPLELMVGELVYELKPPGFDKGTAIRAFMQHTPFTGRTPIFVADHVIDQAGFDTASSLGGYGLSVGSKLPGAIDFFPDTASVRAWLKGLA